MIAIVAPYDRSETTLAASRVAEFALSLGHEVRWMSPPPVRGDVDDHWDSRVRCVPATVRTKPLVGFGRVECAIHFAHVPLVKSAIDAAREGVKQVLVLSWKVHPQDLTIVADYDVVVSPTRTGLDAIHAKASRCFGDKTRQSYVPWTGSPAVPVRRAKVVKRVCVAFDREAADATFGMWAELIDRAMARHRDVTVAVYTPGLSKGDAKRAKELQAIHFGRLHFAKGGGRSRWRTAFAAADCAVLPSLSSEFGAMAALARECGTPVMCHDVEPVAAASDWPVACGVRRRASGAPVAVPDAAKWQAVLDRLMSSGIPAPRTLAKDPPGFEAAWGGILG